LPIVLYGSKSMILEATMKSGVYKIRNVVTDRVYIGSSVDMESRRKQHLRNLKKKQHINSYLQRSYNKYGKGAFIFSILEECEQDQLLEREQFWFEFHTKNGKVYNVKPLCVHSILGMKLSPETRKKISESNKGKPSSRKGVKMSEETKRKISETERRTKNLKKEVQKSVPTGR
jgi:group I intron endonuclease